MDGGSQIHGWLASQPCMWLPHPCSGYIIIGIGIRLDIFLLSWGVFSLFWGGWVLSTTQASPDKSSSPGWGRSPAGRLDGSGAALFLKNLAGRLASQPCIWIHPSILGVYYWYWYIIGCIFLIMGAYFLYHGGYFPYHGWYFPYYGSTQDGTFGRLGYRSKLYSYHQ